MKKAGYGIRGEASLLTKYEADWQHVGSMCLLGQCLYKSHFQGIDEISLSSLTRVLEIRRGVSYISLIQVSFHVELAFYMLIQKATDAALEEKLQRSRCLCRD